MGIEALLSQDDGTPIPAPTSPDEWRSWVSAGRTRNWMLSDPLLDWLHLYGKSRGYRPDKELDGYEQNLDFLAFLFERGHAFEAGILQLLQERFEVVPIAQDYQDIMRLEKAEETFAAMQQGVPILYQAVLWDAHNLTYGAPDFLIRSDVLHDLFPASVSAQDAQHSAPDLGSASWHYCVVDTKFTTVHLDAKGMLANTGSTPAYKAQLYVYNRMLGRLQGFEPPASYLLGRGWQQRKARGSNALERLGPIPQHGTVANKFPIAVAVEEALRWIRRVRTEGQDWHLLPTPSVPELYPNMSNADTGEMMLDIGPVEREPGVGEDDGTEQWVSVKKWLAAELKELTQLWQVGVGKRNEAHERGLLRWDDPQATPEAVGMTGNTQTAVLTQMLTVNRPTYTGPPVLPVRIEQTRGDWHAPYGVEFYVDFEFCSDLNDDCSTLPEKGGLPLIFLIGCGHVEDGAWQFTSWCTHTLSEEEELRITRDWMAHMSAVRDRLDPQNSQPRVFHWSPAEPTALENAHNSARARHRERADWLPLGWYDLLQKVIRAEPVTVRGALGFGLKAVANALHSHGLIATNWNDSPVDGLGAMVGAWRCDAEARQTGVSMTELALMQEIARYNEVDCKVMMEIVRYLRERH